MIKKQILRTIFVLVFVISFSHANIAGATIFQPGETLEPDCAPGSANCGVATTTLVSTAFGGTGLTATPTFGQFLRGTGSGYALVATSTLGVDLVDTIGTLFSARGGTGLTATPAFGQLLRGTGSGYALVATSTLGVDLTDTTGTLFTARGGTGLTATPTFGQILLGTGSGYALMSTSTLGVDLADTTGSLSVARGGTGATSFSQGWLFSSGGGALQASTSPTVNYITATSTTATSTFANGIALSGGCFSVGGVCIGGGGSVSLTNANSWTALQQFNGNASTTLFSSYGGAYIGSVGGSATTTIFGNATSTFGAGVDISSGGLKLSSLTSCHNLGTDGTGNVQCELGQFAIDVRKSADQSTTTNTTLNNDTELAFPIGAGETWVFRFDLLYSTSATPDIQLAVSAPAGATCDYSLGQFSSAISAGTTVCGTALPIANGTVTNEALPLGGSISNGGTAGIVHLQFAQLNSNAAATTIQRGSTLSAFRISGGADLGEVYYSTDTSLVPGTVVALDSTLPAGVARASLDNVPIGIVTTKPGIVIGDTSGASNGIPVIVALAGRVPVKVVTENGAIEAGDYLVLSSEPGVAMKSKGRGHVIGQAMSPYNSDGVGVTLAFVKNFDMSAIEEMSVLIGDISPMANADGSDNGLATLISTIQAESAHDPITIFSDKVSSGTRFITDFITARVTAIRGYFDEIYAHKIHTEQICVKKSDGSEICVTGDELNALLPNAHVSQSVDSPPIETPPAVEAEVIDEVTTDDETQIESDSNSAAMPPIE